MLEIFSWGFMDIFSLLIIIQFIKMMYQKIYKPAAYVYLESQLELFASCSIIYIIVLYIYVYLESIFHIDAKYTNGIIQIVFFGGAGITANQVYKRYFPHKKRIYYIPSKEEYLFIAMVVCGAVSIKMVLEEMIGIVVPLAWILGRLIWLDTSSIKEIKDSLAVSHQRIVESAILFAIGTIFLSILMRFFDYYRILQAFFAVFYGIMILYPYERIRKYIIK